MTKLNRGSVTIDPITVSNSDKILSDRQVLPLSMIAGSLVFADEHISNSYNKVSDDIKDVAEDLIYPIRDKYISESLKTYRVEDYKLCRDDRQTMGVRYLYQFGDAEYQKSPLTGLYHGKFHLWNGIYPDEDYRNSYSVTGQYADGKKNGQWTYERKNKKGELTGRLIINYRNDVKSGFSVLETTDENGSYTNIKAYYDDDHWDKKGTSYYCYTYQVITFPFLPIYETVTDERVVRFDEKGNPHGEVFMRHDDVEVKAKYNHGVLISLEKRNTKKNVTLTPINGEEELKELWELKLPAAFPADDEYNFRFDKNPFIGLTLIDLTAEGKNFQGISLDKKRETNY